MARQLGYTASSWSARWAAPNGRTSTPGRQILAAELPQGGTADPWTGWTLSASWGSREQLAVRLVERVVVAEVAVGVSLDAAGRWRHPVRLERVRSDLTPGDVPLFGQEL
ncbi:hypothetical protein [Streptomyces sp. NPDC059010]|uniref:hypothetical protein n=1 Tax=Streptomyces sp. NPDC059010 TaxID=3346695 RepID=UPI003688EAAD